MSNTNEEYILCILSLLYLLSVANVHSKMFCANYNNLLFGDMRAGELKVKVHGIQADAEANITQVATNRYRCSFIPPESGLYLVTITWGDKQVPGSPFKVNVHARGDPSKVTFKLKDGSTTAVVEMDRVWIVDKRSAGNGKSHHNVAN